MLKIIYHLSNSSVIIPCNPRLTRNGIPSGKTEQDILNEVRKEAFLVKGKSSNEDDADDPLNTSVNSVTASNGKTSSSSSALPSSSSSSSSKPTSSSSVIIKAKDDWENWYPMEWVAWITFGPPCDEPTEHWVNEEIDDGPETNERKKKPNGRVDQRKKENEITASTKVQVESNALRTHSAAMQQQEIAMAEREEDLKKVAFFMQWSKTPAAIVSTLFVT